jgi:membrane-bound serine protease (ClpP class)
VFALLHRLTYTYATSFHPSILDRAHSAIVSPPNPGSAEEILLILREKVSLQQQSPSPSRSGIVALPLRFIVWLLPLLLVGLSATASAATSSPHVNVLTVDGDINPAMARYLDRGLDKSEEDGAAACIVVMDTPGGLLSSTEDMVSRISQAEIPVIVYVPKGAWAASAGAFILLSADVAAMGPESVMGASTPIGEGGEELPEDQRAKAVNLATEWIASIAIEHGRNETAARAAVTHAASFSAREAAGLEALSPNNQEILEVAAPLDPPLIELMADDVEGLVETLVQGITLINGESFDLPEDVRVESVDMSLGEKFLEAISDANIAYILLSIAMLGILAELFHPGLIFPGTVGAICLLLGIYSLDMLEADWAGLLLMLLAAGLFIAEVFTPTFGLLLAGGLVSLVLGSLILFAGSPFEVDRRLIAGVAVAFAAMIIYVVVAILRSEKEPITTGREGLAGETAVARTRLDPQGVVFIGGERWNATAQDETIEEGEEVTVIEVKGLNLHV